MEKFDLNFNEEVDSGFHMDEIEEEIEDMSFNEKINVLEENNENLSALVDELSNQLSELEELQDNKREDITS